MMMRKSCPRCRGDLFLDRSDGPALWTCLQCGRAYAPAAPQEQPTPLAAVRHGQAA